MIGAGRGWTRAGAALLAVAVLMASGCRDRSDPDPTPRSYGKVLEPATTGAEADPEADDDADLERIVELQIEKAGADGRWRGYRTHANDETLTDVQRAQVAQLEALGYVTGTVSPPEAAGITVHDRERAHAGLNLLTSGHGQVAQLMDMDGRVLHEWTADFWAIWPDYPAARHVSGNEYFRRVHLFDDGSLLAIYEGLGIIKLDKDSNVLWANPCRAHHDLHVQPDGIIAVLTREAHVLPRINPARPVLEDFVTLLGPDGEERSRLSLLECFENSERHRRVLVGLGQKKTLDLFHTNAIRVLDGALADTHPAFAAGNYLISCCRLDRIAVVDPAAREVIWTLRDDWHRHHDPDLLPRAIARQKADPGRVPGRDRGPHPLPRDLSVHTPAVAKRAAGGRPAVAHEGPPHHPTVPPWTVRSRVVVPLGGELDVGDV